MSENRNFSLFWHGVFSLALSLIMKEMLGGLDWETAVATAVGIFSAVLICHVGLLCWRRLRGGAGG